jgi:hypothetical protein
MMLNMHLAELYGVETTQLNEQDHQIMLIVDYLKQLEKA